MTIRDASHAGSWYSSSKSVLSKELDTWLEAVPEQTQGIGSVSSQNRPVGFPVPGARAIIAPHAGYAYSGPAAAWAYKALDLSQAKRIFLLGPSHHVYLTNCALSTCTYYSTPLGNLKVDLPTVAELKKSGVFGTMTRQTDEDEHSLEMHLPYIYKILSQHFQSESEFPTLVPILVGATEGQTERQFGRLLAPYFTDPTSIFILSSDFCHWGSRFRYTYYQPAENAKAYSLRSSDKIPKAWPIHESIAAVDQECMDKCEGGSHDEWLEVLERTGNTVCGRHPIGVFMAAVESLADQSPEKGKFRFLRYERSSNCISYKDSSVSYCSAFAVL